MQATQLIMTAQILHCANSESAWTRMVSAAIAMLAFGIGAMGETPEYPRMGPDIFDAVAEGNVLIAAAVAEAGRSWETERSQKPIFLFIGANWCPWTRRLHHIMRNDPTVASMMAKFAVVYLDANTRRDRSRNAAVMKALGYPTKKMGIPAFVMVSASGEKIAEQETQSFAAPSDIEVAGRLREFLQDWLSKAASNTQTVIVPAKAQ
jgi:thiol:disulfide interchange protein